VLSVVHNSELNITSLAPVLPAGFTHVYGTTARRIGTTVSKIPTTLPVIYISFDPLRSTWPTSDFQQAQTWSKLSPLG